MEEWRPQEPVSVEDLRAKYRQIREELTEVRLVIKKAREDIQYIKRVIVVPNNNTN